MAAGGLSLGLALLSTCTSIDLQYPGVFGFRASFTAYFSAPCRQSFFSARCLAVVAFWNTAASFWDTSPHFWMLHAFRISMVCMVQSSAIHSKCRLDLWDHSCRDLCVSSGLSLKTHFPGWPYVSSLPRSCLSSSTVFSKERFSTMFVLLDSGAQGWVRILSYRQLCYCPNCSV